VKEKVEVEVGSEVPAHLVQILQTSPFLRTVQGQTCRLLARGKAWPLVIHRQTAEAIQARQAQSSGKQRRSSSSEQALILVVAPRLGARDRKALEEVDCSYVDATGAVHVQTPTVLVHAEPHNATHRWRLVSPQGLGVVAVRLVQHLLQDPQRTWTVSELATETGASLGQAHKVLTRLETEGLLLQQQRTGRAVPRRLRDPGAVLDWLAQVPAAGKLHQRLKTYAYAPNPGALMLRLAHAAHVAQVPWALTGAAAAGLWSAGDVVTALPVLMVRIDPQVPLTVAANHLDLEPVDTGHNLLLVRDVGQLATYPPIPTHNTVPIAPKVRVWLDMLTEPRGHDAAAQFREAVLGY